MSRSSHTVLYCITGASAAGTPGNWPTILVPGPSEQGLLNYCNGPTNLDPETIAVIILKVEQWFNTID